MLPIALQQTLFGPVLDALFFFAGVFWFFRVTADLFKMLPAGHKLKMNVFRFHFYFPIIYFTIATFLLGGHSISLPLKDNYNHYEGYLLLMDIFAIYCLLYCALFFAKALVSSYRQTPDPPWTSYIGYVLALWMYPIGIWFIQPKVKVLLGRQASA
jgi:hypothetical protein